MLRPIQPYIEYALNQDYIAEFLCINKDQPKLQCNGKCHLAKQIEKQQEEAPLTALGISLEHYPIGFVNILKIESSSNHGDLQKENQFYYNKLYAFSYIDSEFQPPDIV